MHERGTDMEYTGYLGEVDVEFQIWSVLRSFGWKFGIDWLTEEIWSNTEMHLVIGYVWAMQGKGLYIWDQCPLKFAIWNCCTKSSSLICYILSYLVGI